MSHRLFSVIVYFFLSASILFSAPSEEDFFLINAENSKVILELGSHADDRISPFSTFKIALSLMGYDAEILTDEKTPTWEFREGYVDYLESWKVSQTPLTWMKNSCVWYSQVLATHLGLEKLKQYVQSIEYGNQDMSGGLTTAWLGSSLQISPREQVSFIQKMINHELPISSKATQMTKSLLLVEELPGEWKLFGKTGTGCINKEKATDIGWFIGWVEKGTQAFIFAYAIRNQKTTPSERILRTKQILAESEIFKTKN